MSKARVSQHIIDLLEEGLQATRMSSARFDRPGQHFSEDAYSDEVREATRLYRQSWVETPLAVVLAYLKGDIDDRQARYLWEGANYGHIDPDVKDPRALLGLKR